MSKYTEAYNSLAEKLDARDKFFTKLKAFYLEYGYIPDSWADEWQVCLKDGQKPWREQRKVVRMVKRAARRAARNV